MGTRGRQAFPPHARSAAGSQLTQDTDVLDTWFSSGLWPFSTLGWPDDTEDLRTFYPTSLLISGYDILFFWDARMIMMGLHLTGGADLSQRLPFRRLYLHSLVRTAEGAKMSKTKGTGVDPLELTQKFGTDALRYMLASMAAPGTDIILSEDRILGARAFANKIWNAARFLFVNLEKVESQGISIEELAAPEIRAKAPYAVPGEGALAHRWIFSRLSAVTAQVNDALENFRFHEASQLIYHFFWGDFCDWYIEWVKPQIGASRPRSRHPGVAEYICGARSGAAAAASDHALPDGGTVAPAASACGREVDCAGCRFPNRAPNGRTVASKKTWSYLQAGIVSARNQRAELKVAQKEKVPAEVLILDEPERKLVEENRDTIMRLASLSELRSAPRPAGGTGGGGGRGKRRSRISA